LQRRARTREQARVRLLARSIWSPDLEDAWQRMTQQLDRIRSVAENRDVPALLLVAPYRFQVLDPKGLRQPQDRLVRYAETNGIAYLDLLREMEAIPEQAAYGAFNDESHLSWFGHYMVADLLLDPVSELLGLDASGGAPDPADRVGRKLMAKSRAFQLASEAQAAGERGAYQEAMTLLDKAQDLAPDVGLIYQFRSNVAYLMGDRHRAIRALVRGLALEPDNPLFQQNLTALREGLH
jgi:tetratricopeptide (TPR) repeat protein